MRISSILDGKRESPRAEAIRRALTNKIVGQKEAIDAVVQVMDKFHAGLYDCVRPIGSLLFLGPTGVGKTALAEELCTTLFDSPRALIKVDCGEFQHSHEVAKLIGSPPGYLGHRETTSRFTQTKLEANYTVDYPLSVVLFDEIEKASDALWNLLLGILDKGTLTLGTNETVNFSRTIILMTSNVGSGEMNFAIGDHVGFSGPDKGVNEGELKDIAVKAAKRKFPPEFINRIDKMIAFHTLTKEQNLEILGIELAKLQELIFLRCNPVVIFKVSKRAKLALLERGYDPKYNARFLRRAIETEIQMPLVRIIAGGEVNRLDMVTIDYKHGDFVFGRIPREAFEINTQEENHERTAAAPAAAPAVAPDPLPAPPASDQPSLFPGFTGGY